jgi:hypothetical protein
MQSRVEFEGAENIDSKNRVMPKTASKSHSSIKRHDQNRKIQKAYPASSIPPTVYREVWGLHFLGQDIDPIKTEFILPFPLSERAIQPVLMFFARVFCDQVTRNPDFRQLSTINWADLCKALW